MQVRPVSARGDVAEAVERELLLLRRHAASSGPLPGPSRLDRSAYLLLTRLEAGSPMTLRQLAGALGLDVSTVNRQSAALLREGLAERVAGLGEELARRYRPTREGLERVHQERAVRAGHLRDLVSGWSVEEREQLLASLRRLNEEIERRYQECWPRAD